MLISAKIGRRLHEERDHLGLNQADFGKLVGVSRRTQAAYEADTNSPDIRYLEAAEKAGVDILYVLSGSRGGDSLAPVESNLINAVRRLPSEKATLLLAVAAAMSGEITPPYGAAVSGMATTLHSPSDDYKGKPEGD